MVIRVEGYQFVTLKSQGNQETRFFEPPFKQVGSPTKARAGPVKIGLPLNWEAAVGFAKWGIVIFSDQVSKDRLARLD